MWRFLLYKESELKDMAMRRDILCYIQTVC